MQGDRPSTSLAAPVPALVTEITCAAGYDTRIVPNPLLLDQYVAATLEDFRRRNTNHGGSLPYLTTVLRSTRPFASCSGAAF